MLEKRAKLLRDIFDLTILGVGIIHCSACPFDDCGKGCSVKLFEKFATMFGFERDVYEEYYRLRRSDNLGIEDCGTLDTETRRAGFLINCVVSNGWQSVECNDCLLGNMENCAKIGKGCHVALANSLRDMFNLPPLKELIIKNYKYDYLEAFYE